MDWADEAVDEILSDLNDRAGMGTSDVDEETMDEIRSKWAALIRGAGAKYGALREGA